MPSLAGTAATSASSGPKLGLGPPKALQSPRCPSSKPCSRARSSTLAEARRSRSTRCWPTARSDAPPCPPGRRPESTRPWSSGTATPPASAARASCRRSPTSTTDRAGDRRRGGARPAGDRRDAPGPGRDAGQVTARSRTRSSGLARRRASLAQSVRAAALPLPRRPERRRAAGAVHERDQRRRARRQRARAAGVHDRAGGGGVFSEAVRWCAEIYQVLKSTLKARHLATGVGDEGGFAPELATAHEALSLLTEAIEKAGLEVGDEVALAMDPACSEIYREGAYQLEGRQRSSEEMVEYWRGLSTASRSSARGPARRGRLGRVGAADVGARLAGAGRRRRPLRHEPRTPGTRHRRGRRQRDPDQAEPDRLAHRDARHDRARRLGAGSARW